MIDEIIKSLTTSWLNTADGNLHRLERYYLANQSLADNGMFTAADQADGAVRRLFKPINITSMVVDEPVASLASGKVKVTSNSANERLELWAADYYRRRIRRAWMTSRGGRACTAKGTCTCGLTVRAGVRA